MKDMKKQAAEGRAIIRKFDALDLTADEANQLFNLYKRGGQTFDALLDVITAAYYSGIATGTRHGKRETTKERVTA